LRGSRRPGISSVRGPDEAPGAESGRLTVPFLLDERKIFGHIVKSFEYRRERDLMVPSELFGRERIGAVDGLLDDHRSDASPLSL
jgi:hypothetical protein